MTTGPFQGIRVIDMSQGDGAPVCGMELGDAGADVVKVEPLDGDWTRPLGPPFDHGDGPLFMSSNRNKRSIAVDLESDQGKEVVRRLLKGADVLLENFPTQRDIKRLGLTYEELSSINPRLIYCDVSYLGRTGPQAEKPSTDLTVQAHAGMMRFVGEKGAPPAAFGENYTGVVTAMYATIAISAALFWRLRGGRGQKIETSYLRDNIGIQNNVITSDSNPDQPSPAGQNVTPQRGYKTKDGRVLFSFGYAPFQDPWAEFCKAFNVPEETRKRFTPEQVRRVAAGGVRDEMTKVYEEAFKDKTTEEVYSTLDKMGFMCAYVHDLDSLFHDPGVLEQQMLLEVDHPQRGKVKTIGLAWKFTETPGSVRLAPPMLGEHTDEILREVGYNPQEIQALHALKVVR